MASSTSVASSAMASVPEGKLQLGSTATEIDRLLIRFPGLERDLVENEIGSKHIRLGAFEIDVHPVSNCEFRSFIHEGGYSRRELWDREGWAWLTSRDIQEPLFASVPQWNDCDRPVVGVSWYEAAAYARWAGK